jgi:hypothetical protein
VKYSSLLAIGHIHFQALTFEGVQNIHSARQQAADCQRLAFEGVQNIHSAGKQARRCGG